MITSLVVHGDGIGKSAGYPTANLNVRKKDVTLTPGVYAALATLNRTEYQAALVIQDSPWKVEVFFMEYHGPDFYGSRISVVPFQKVSEIEPHDSTGELIQKIEEDLKLIRDLFRDIKK